MYSVFGGVFCLICQYIPDGIQATGDKAPRPSPCGPCCRASFQVQDESAGAAYPPPRDGCGGRLCKQVSVRLDVHHRGVGLNVKYRQPGGRTHIVHGSEMK